MVDARMAPRPDGEENLVMAVMGLHGAKHCGRTVGIFLVPLTDDKQRRHGHRLSAHPFINRLERPEIGIGRVFHQLAIGRDLVNAVTAHVVARRARFEIAGIVIADAMRDGCSGSFGDALADDIVNGRDSESAIMEVIIADPGIDHRALWRSGFQGRVRVDFGHQGGEAEIGGTDHTDLAVGFRRMFHQPVDGVIGIGGFINAGRVQRSDNRPRHDKHAF